MSKTKNYFFFSLLALFLILDSLIIGFYLGAKYLKNSASASATNNEEVPPLSVEIFGLSGTIAALENNYLTLENQEPTIKYDAQTEFIKINNDPELPPPAPDSSALPQAISSGELKVGDLIAVSADEDIKNKSEFTAIKIILIINQ